MDWTKRVGLSLVIACSMGAPAWAAPLDLTATPIPLSQNQPDLDRVGALRFEAGFALSSSSPDFGGLSGMILDDDGQHLLAVGDKGRLFDLGLTNDAKGLPQRFQLNEIRRLAGPDGNTVTGAKDKDSEDLSPDGQGGFYVSFEHHHRIWHYPATAKGAAVPLPSPPGLTELPANKGIEALTRLNDGRLLAISEAPPADGAWHQAWIGNQDGWEPLRYAANDGFLPTGAATLANGDVLVVERFFNPLLGLAVRIRRLDGNAIAPNANLQGDLLAELGPDLSIDNFEAIDVRTAPDGRALIYLLSDDNFQPVQRTLLLVFSIRPDKEKGPAD